MTLLRTVLFSWICLGLCWAAEPPEFSALYGLNQSPGLIVRRKTNLDGDVYRPTGLVRTMDRIYLACSQETVPAVTGEAEKPDNLPRGQAHLLIFNASGERLHEIRLGPAGQRFQTSGLSSDGDRLWIAVSERGEDPVSVVYTVNLRTRRRRRMFDFPDTIEALVVDAERRILYAYNSKYERYVLSLSGRLLERDRSPDGFLQVRDGKVLSDGKTLVSGSRRHVFMDTEPQSEDPKTSTYPVRAGIFGGLAAHTHRGQQVFSLPVGLTSRHGRVLPFSAFDFQFIEGRPRFYWVPDDAKGVLYEVAPRHLASGIGPSLTRPRSGRVPTSTSKETTP